MTAGEGKKAPPARTVSRRLHDRPQAGRSSSTPSALQKPAGLTLRRHQHPACRYAPQGAAGSRGAGGEQDEVLRLPSRGHVAVENDRPGRCADRPAGARRPPVRRLPSPSSRRSFGAFCSSSVLPLPIGASGPALLPASRIHRTQKGVATLSWPLPATVQAPPLVPEKRPGPQPGRHREKTD